MLRGGLEGAGAQLQDHVPHGARDQAAPRPVHAPLQEGDDDQHHAGRPDKLQARLRAQQVDQPADEDGEGGEEGADGDHQQHHGQQGAQPAA